MRSGLVHMRKYGIILAALAMFVAACGIKGVDDPAQVSPSGIRGKLRVGLIPNVSPDTQRAAYQPLGEYLARKLGVEVELHVASDYAGVVVALAAGRLDVAYLGGLTYAQAERQVALTPLVTEVDAESGMQTYVSAVVVRRDSPFTNLRSDIVRAGRSFAFGDVASTSGSLYPRIMLVDAGARCSAADIRRCPPLGDVTFTGGHDATALAVLNGKADAGGLELRILHRLERTGQIPVGALRVIAQRDVQGYPWVMRSQLGERARMDLTEAFTSIKDPALLDLLRARRYVPVDRADYDEIRREAGRMGLLEKRS